MFSVKRPNSDPVTPVPQLLQRTFDKLGDERPPAPLPRSNEPRPNYYVLDPDAIPQTSKTTVRVD